MPCQAEQAERPVGGPEEEPLTDPAPHPALLRVLLKALGQPARSGEELLEERPELAAGVGSRCRPVDDGAGGADEIANHRGVQDPLVVVERL